MSEREKLIKQRDAIAKEIKQLENQQKVLLSKQTDEERRKRTRRLIGRGAMLESVFPELAPCEDTEVMAFLVAVSRMPQMAEWLA